MIVAERLRRKRKITSTTSTSVSSSVNVTSCTDSWIVAERSYSVDTLHRRRNLGLAACSSAAFTRFATATVFVPGWRWIASTIDARAVVPARRLVVLHVVGDAAELAEVHRRAVAIRDDHVAELRSAFSSWPVACTVSAVCGPHSTPVGRLTFWLRHRRRDVLERDLARRELRRDRAGCAPRTSARRTPAPAPRRRPSRAAARCVVSPNSSSADSGTSVGRQREREDRRVGGIRLLVRRRDDALRQLPQRLRDRRLHVLRGRVDVPVERELDDDLRLPEARRRRHVVDAGDRRELLLERRRDRRRHRLRARAGQRRAHRDRREVDVRQIAHRQLPVRDDAEDENARS